MQEMRKDPTRVRPPPQKNEDNAPKAAGPSRPSRSPVELHPQSKDQSGQMYSPTSPRAPNAHATASTASRRGIVSNSSSEYATTDTEEDYDDSCASEGISEGAVDAAGTSTGKHLSMKEEIRLRGPALEAQRQRELFVKHPKRSYLNPGRVQTRQTSGATAPQAPSAYTTSVVPRSGIMSSSSSEYVTTDTEDEDDDNDDNDGESEGVRKGVVDIAGTSTGKQHPTKDEIRLREAALEAQRQRELFVKQPKESYSNRGRTQSGLLSQLLSPDPNMIPPRHRVASDHDVARTTGIPSTLTSGKSPTAPQSSLLSQLINPDLNMFPTRHRVASDHDVTRTTGILSTLTSSESPAALPLAAQVTAQAPMVTTASSSKRGGYRPKGRPQGEDSEPEDESDGFDDPEDTIQDSHSLVQQRFPALAAAKSSRKRAPDNQVRR